MAKKPAVNNAEMKRQAAALKLAFAEAGKDIATALERGILAASIFVEGDAKKRVPVDTGLLRASLGHRVTIKGNEVVGQVGTSVEYGPYIEFGTTKREPRPFLTPALTENKTTINQIIVRELKKEL
jgi:HK97 gp10 family phage protein